MKGKNGLAHATFYEESTMKRRGGWFAVIFGVVMVGCGVGGMLEKAAEKKADTIKDATQ